MSYSKAKDLHKAGFDFDVIAEKTGIDIDELTRFLLAEDTSLIGVEATDEILSIMKGETDPKNMLNRALLVGVARAEDMLLNAPLSAVQVKSLCSALSGLYQTAYPNQENTLVQVNVNTSDDTKVTKNALLALRKKHLEEKKDD